MITSRVRGSVHARSITRDRRCVVRQNTGRVATGEPRILGARHDRSIGAPRCPASSALPCRRNARTTPAMTARTLTVGGGTYPLVLPNIRDPRLHVASVIITIHVLGQVGAGLRGQRAADPGRDPDLRGHRDRAHVPADEGVRLAGQRDAHRQRRRTDPARRRARRPATTGRPTRGTCSRPSPACRCSRSTSSSARGSHIFNPSNIGLVVAFVVLGTTRVEPLDFWWAPLDGWMIAAYAVILVGGLLITRRLRCWPSRRVLARAGRGGRRPGWLGPLHDRELGVRAGLRRRLLARDRRPRPR